VAFSPDGMTIVSSSDDSTIKVWDAGAWALPPSNPHYPNLTAPVPAAASLELKAEKQRTHVTSVAFSPDGTTIVSSSPTVRGSTIKVWDAGASALIALNLSPKLTAPLPAAASLELKAEKQSAHSKHVMSVAFSPDGKTIVSGSDGMIFDRDGTIKVWDAGVGTCHPPTLNPNLTAPVLAAASLELKAEKQSAHPRGVSSLAFSPDGKTIVSGSADKTARTGAIKVWDASVGMGS